MSQFSASAMGLPECATLPETPRKKQSKSEARLRDEARKACVPAGDQRQHEIKFDGFRVQIHKLGNEVELFSRNGSRFSRRFAAG